MTNDVFFIFTASIKIIALVLRHDNFFSQNWDDGYVKPKLVALVLHNINQTKLSGRVN